jgi:inosine-uridine nucleoside N-ribohydrolase
MSNKKINIILDNDGSSDDAIAFALASNSSKINLIAVVSSYGSNTIEINTNNNAEYISATKTDTKLYIGAGASLDGKTPAINLFYGEDNKCLAQLEKHKSADTKAKNIYKKL